MAKQSDEIRSDIRKILHLLESNNRHINYHPPATADEKYLIDGYNVMEMPTRDAISFGLELLEMLFSPEEVSRSLVYASKRPNCTKPGLEKEKVNSFSLGS